MSEVLARLVLDDETLDELARRVAAILRGEVERAPEPRSEYLSVDEACQLLRCRPQRIYDLRSSGRLTRYGDGSRALVSRAELEAYLAGGRRSR